jgi:hypothetical protein
MGQNMAQITTAMDIKPHNRTNFKRIKSHRPPPLIYISVKSGTVTHLAVPSYCDILVMISSREFVPHIFCFVLTFSAVPIFCVHTFATLCGKKISI